MRILALIFVCAELLLVFALVTAPIMTSHKPLAAAVNRYSAAPSAATKAEVERLREATRVHDRAEMVRTSALLLANTSALLVAFWFIQRQNRRLRAAPVTGLLL
jgi:hypothetical protein